MWVKRGKKNVKQYAGCWECGMMCGFGSFFFENGDIYKGEWAANKRSGDGRLDYPNGDYFIGQWQDDVQRGYGTMYLKNGNVFEGLYRAGLKDGPGRFFYSATKKVCNVIYTSVHLLENKLIPRGQMEQFEGNVLVLIHQWWDSYCSYLVGY